MTAAQIEIARYYQTPLQQSGVRERLETGYDRLSAVADGNSAQRSPSLFFRPTACRNPHQYPHTVAFNFIAPRRQQPTRSKPYRNPRQHSLRQTIFKPIFGCILRIRSTLIEFEPPPLHRHAIVSPSAMRRLPPAVQEDFAADAHRLVASICSAYLFSTTWLLTLIHDQVSATRSKRSARLSFTDPRSDRFAVITSASSTISFPICLDAVSARATPRSGGHRAELARDWNGRCTHGCDDKANAKDGLATAAGFVRPAPFEGLPFDTIDLPRQCSVLLNER